MTKEVKEPVSKGPEEEKRPRYDRPHIEGKTNGDTINSKQEFVMIIYGPYSDLSNFQFQLVNADTGVVCSAPVTLVNQDPVNHPYQTVRSKAQRLTEHVSSGGTVYVEFYGRGGGPTRHFKGDEYKVY